MPDELPDLLDQKVREARAELLALAQEMAEERRLAHEAAAALREAVRLAKEEMRQHAKGEARKALAAALARATETLRVKD